MKQILKLTALILGAALAFGFASCKADPDTEYVIVEKKVEVPKEVPTDITSHDATAVYHWKQNTNGVGYTQKTTEENADGTNKKDDSGNTIAIVNAQTVAAGTKLESIAKTFYGFKVKGLVESLQADGTYAVNVYYDRNPVTVNITGGVSDTLKGLYGSDIDLTSVNKKLPQGSFITSSTVPATFPASDASYTVTLGTTTVDSKDGFVKIAKGTFKCANSSTSTAYNITLTKDFYMCDHEVTQGEWEKYMIWYGEVNSNSSYRPESGYGKGENYPAYYVNWYEAVIYCNLLSIANNLTPAYYIEVTENEQTVKKTNPADWVNISGSNIKNTEAGKYYYDGTSENSKLDYKGESDTDGGIRLDTSANGYRLPTEAEWEYAALGNFKDNANWNGYGDSSNTSAYVFAGYDGTNPDSIGNYAWYRDNADGITHEVKGKLPNSYGLYDMSGNVYELCHDWYGSYAFEDTTDPTGPDYSIFNSRVRRGGSISCRVSVCTVSERTYISTTCYRNNDMGFRVVRNAQ